MGKNPIWKTYRHSWSKHNLEESKRELRPWLPEEQHTWRTRRASSPAALLSSTPFFCRFQRKDLQHEVIYKSRSKSVHLRYIGLFRSKYGPLLRACIWSWPIHTQIWALITGLQVKLENDSRPIHTTIWALITGRHSKVENASRPIHTQNFKT